MPPRELLQLSTRVQQQQKEYQHQQQEGGNKRTVVLQPTTAAVTLSSALLSADVACFRKTGGSGAVRLVTPIWAFGGATLWHLHIALECPLHQQVLSVCRVLTGNGVFCSKYDTRGGVWYLTSHEWCNHIDARDTHFFPCHYVLRH